MKILVADDEPDLLEFVQELLESEGHEVISAKNGKIAYDLFVKENPDMIISDYRMPFKNGLTLYQDVSKIKKDIPFIFLTGYIGEVNPSGENYIILSKPVKIHTLMETVNKAIIGNLKEKKIS